MKKTEFVCRNNKILTEFEIWNIQNFHIRDFNHSIFVIFAFEISFFEILIFRLVLVILICTINTCTRKHWLKFKTDTSVLEDIQRKSFN